MGNLAVLKSKKALRQFSKRCGRGGISAVEMINAIRDYLNDRLNLSLGLLTSGEAYDLLSSQGVRHETALKVKETIKELEDTVYTGRGQDECRIVEDIKQLICLIDREVK
jgi:hypothetical protein